MKSILPGVKAAKIKKYKEDLVVAKDSLSDLTGRGSFDKNKQKDLLSFNNQGLKTCQKNLLGAKDQNGKNLATKWVEYTKEIERLSKN